MPKVYIPSILTGRDMSPATQFGQLVEIVPDGTMLFDGQKALGIVREALKDITDEDYIVGGGDPFLIALATAVAVEYTGKVNFLRWSRHHQDYALLESDFDDE